MGGRYFYQRLLEILVEKMSPLPTRIEFEEAMSADRTQGIEVVT